jgi:chromosome partitioning protein
MDDAPTEKCVVQARKNVDIICSNERLFPAEMSMSKMQERELILGRKLSTLNGYDFVLIDCAPNMNLLNQNVLLYSEELLLPVSMEYLSLIGVKQLLKNIKILNKVFTRDINISKVIPTFFDKRYKKSKDIVESLKRVFPGRISTPISHSVSLSEAPGFRRTIFEHAPHSKGAEDYLKLAEEVIHGKKRTV